MLADRLRALLFIRRNVLDGTYSHMKEELHSKPTYKLHKLLL